MWWSKNNELGLLPWRLKFNFFLWHLIVVTYMTKVSIIYTYKVEWWVVGLMMECQNINRKVFSLFIKILKLSFSRSQITSPMKVKWPINCMMYILKIWFNYKYFWIILKVYPCQLIVLDTLVNHRRDTLEPNNHDMSPCTWCVSIYVDPHT